MKISLAEAPQSCFSLDPCRKINDVNVHQTMENHGMLLRYRLSTFEEKALKLSVISLTSQADVFRSLSHVPAPPMSAETSGYKRTRTRTRSHRWWESCSKRVRGTLHVCVRIQVGIQEKMQTKLDTFLQTHRATHTALGKSPRELLMNRQPKPRFSVLRAKSLKQYYVKGKCKEKPKTFFGPIFA